MNTQGVPQRPPVSRGNYGPNTAISGERSNARGVSCSSTAKSGTKELIRGHLPYKVLALNIFPGNRRAGSQWGCYSTSLESNESPDETSTSFVPEVAIRRNLLFLGPNITISIHTGPGQKEPHAARE